MHAVRCRGHLGRVGDAFFRGEIPMRTPEGPWFCAAAVLKFDHLGTSKKWDSKPAQPPSSKPFSVRF